MNELKKYLERTKSNKDFVKSSDKDKPNQDFVKSSDKDKPNQDFVKNKKSNKFLFIILIFLFIILTILSFIYFSQEILFKKDKQELQVLDKVEQLLDNENYLKTQINKLAESNTTLRKEIEELWEFNNNINENMNLVFMFENIFANNYEKDIDDINVNIEKNFNNYVRGTAVIDSEVFIFLAVKYDEDWEIVFEDKESIKCEIIKDYNFPENMINDCL